MKEKNSKVFIAVTVVLVAVICVLSVCLVTVVSKSDSGLSGNSEDYIEFNVGRDIVVPTPYCELHFPAEYSENLRVAEDKDGKIHKFVFIAYFENRASELFTVSFGDYEQEKIGDIQAIGGGIPVSVIWPETDVKDELTVNSLNVYYAMQESVNYLIESLNGATNFIPAA